MTLLTLALSIVINLSFVDYVSSQEHVSPDNTNLPKPNDTVQIPLSILEYVAINTPANCALKMESKQQSLTGRHFRYIQFYQGFPINGARLDIHTDVKNNISLVQNQLIKDVLFESSMIRLNASGQNKSKLVWAKYNNEWVLAEWKMTDSLLGEHSLIYEGLILDQKNTKLFYQQPDTMVAAKVFLINPLQTAQRVYGSPYIDSMDLDVPQINAERQWVKMKVEFSNDTFRLRHKRYWFEEIAAPVTQIAYSLTDTFDFLRSEPQFEDVNAFYHITTFSDYIENLGLASVLSDTLVIDAHGQFGSDVSSFNYGIFPVELEFGEGGIDDAEDGEVVVHEFGHSMSVKAAPETLKGVERLAMEEGTADYFSTSYGRSYGNFGWREVFDWDGHNPFFKGIFTGVTKNYLTDLTRDTDLDRELWSSPLMCIYEKLGRETCDSLVLEHLFYQTTQTKMPDMANIMLKIDTMLWQGKHYYDIKSCFVDFNILQWGKDGMADTKLNGGITISNSFGFATGAGNLNIQSNQAGEISIIASDMLGREVGKWHSTESVKISPTDFQSGIYQLIIQQNDVHLLYKIIKN